MNEHQLDAEDRALIDAALGYEDPSEAIRERVHTKVMARVAGAVAAGTTVATATTGATAAAATTGGVVGGGLLTNLLIVVGLASAGAGAAVVTTALEEPARPATVAPVAAPQRATASAVVTATQPVAPAARERSPEPADSAIAVVEPTTSARPQPSSDPLKDEAALLHRAQRKLQSGDANGALELLEAHEREHGGGMLREEREAARVFALCKAGRREQARAAAARFLRESPQSPLAERVRTACLK